MLIWVAIFLVIAIIAGLLRMYMVAGIASEIARILFFIFVILFLVSLVYHLFYYKMPPIP